MVGNTATEPAGVDHGEDNAMNPTTLHPRHEHALPHDVAGPDHGGQPESSSTTAATAANGLGAVSDQNQMGV